MVITLQLSACGGVQIWPGSNDVQVDPRTPAGSTEYQCDKGRKFYVKLVDKGESVWMILADREFGMAKAGPNAYGNGVSSLTMEGNTAVFNDGYQGSYSNCAVKAATPK